MKRYVGPLVAGILGALIVFGGYAIEWNIGADKCDGSVMQEGDRCIDLTSDDSYAYDDINARKAEEQYIGGLVGLGVGGVLIIGALVSATSAARDWMQRRADAAAAVSEWPKPENPGIQELHTSFTSGASVTLFTHALRYIDENRAERWVSWTEIDHVRPNNFSPSAGRIHFIVHISARHGKTFAIAGYPDNQNFLRSIKQSIAQATLRNVLDILEMEGAFMVKSSTGLRLTTDGFVHKVEDADRELPWSQLTGLVSGNDKLISITHAEGTWDSFYAASGTNAAALNVAHRLWARTRSGQRT